MKILYKLVMFCSLLAAAIGANSASLEKLSIKIGSTIDSVENDRSMILIDDTYFKMALNMKVVDIEDEKIGRYALKAGQKVIFSLADGAEKDSAQRVINYIKVLK